MLLDKIKSMISTRFSLQIDRHFGKLNEPLALPADRPAQKT